MKHRQMECVAVAAVCLFAVCLAYAGPKDFWETKPYTEWTLKEVEKLLHNESPWTQTHLLGYSTQQRPNGHSERRLCG